MYRNRNYSSTSGALYEDNWENDKKHRNGIPCGQCTTMDLVAGALMLNGGLDARGKLVFEAGYELSVLKMMHVVVQWRGNQHYGV